MKLTRILALALVGVMAVLCLASCGATAPTITVTLKINCGDPSFPVILDVPVAIKSENPTVLEAFIEGCVVNEMDYSLDASEEFVVDIDQYKDYTDAETNTTYYWYFTVNGEEPKSGKAVNTPIADGDVIEYIYTSFVPEEK